MSHRPLLPGDPDRIAGYVLEARLGEGGQGAVYLGRDGEGRPVAVKILHPRLLEDGSARRRFVVELAAARQVARFCTAQVLDADTEGDRPYIVSEYVDGRSLQDVVAQSGPRRDADLDRLAIGTATALAAIHEAGVVHCDFKPGNVLLAQDGPRVIDFGIARALDAGGTTSSVIGTPAYMAPEQITSSDIRPPVDVFAWGATMAFAVNATSPFAAASGPATIYRVLETQPDLGELDGRLRELVEACLAKDPAARPTARDLLLGLVSGSHVTSAPSTPTAPSAPSAPAQVRGPSTVQVTRVDAGGDPTRRLPQRRRGGRLIGAAVAAAVLVAAVVAGVVLIPRLTTPPATAIPEAFAGRWNGSGRLPDEGTTVYPDVVLTAGGLRAELGSGESSCAGGSLVFVSATDSRLEMDFSPNEPRCPSGTMVFEVTGDRALSMYLEPEATTSYSAALTR